MEIYLSKHTENIDDDVLDLAITFHKVNLQ